jgi:hypothetical protein
MPVEDEVERALASMRAGLLSGSRIVVAGLASLQQQLTETPAEEREAVRAAVTQIFSAQGRLNARAESLPASSWQGFTAMVSTLKEQQTVLDQLDQLLNAHMLRQQLEEAEITPLPDAPPPRVFLSTPNGLSMPNGEPLLAAREALEDLEASRAQDARRAHAIRRARHTRRAPVDDRFEDDEPKSLFSAAREWTSGFRGLAAMVLAAVFLSVFPRDIKLHDIATKLVAMVGTETESAASGASDPTARPEATSSSPPAAPTRRSGESVAPTADVGAVTDRPRPLVTAPSDQRRATGSAAAPQDIGAATDRADRPTLAELGDRRPAGARAAIDEPTVPLSSIPEEQFVPVVFTHKDYAMVLQALAELKQQYPSILSGRKEAVQPVDLGKKGIWHRLVFLPAGPRPLASELCDQLMAAGYDRCWVKEY